MIARKGIVHNLFETGDALPSTLVGRSGIDDANARPGLRGCTRAMTGDCCNLARVINVAG